MAFRGGYGRGRGRFGGGGGFRFAKQKPFILFPEIELPDKNNITSEIDLVRRNDRLRRSFRNTPYFHEKTLSDNKEGSLDVQTYSDRTKNSRDNRDSLLSSGFLKLEPGYFPLELVQGAQRRTGRKVRWNPKRDRKLNLLEQLDEKHKDQDPKSKKEDEEDEEDEEDAEIEEEDSSDDDYGQGEYVDDDEDDFNVDEGEDEALL